jgi:hypothetical protein
LRRGLGYLHCRRDFAKVFVLEEAQHHGFAVFFPSRAIASSSSGASWPKRHRRILEGWIAYKPPVREIAAAVRRAESSTKSAAWFHKASVQNRFRAQAGGFAREDDERPPA